MSFRNGELSLEYFCLLDFESIHLLDVYWRQSDSFTSCFFIFLFLNKILDELVGFIPQLLDHRLVILVPVEKLHRLILLLVQLMSGLFDRF